MDKVLVLAPHADDAEFGMGGYLCRMAREEKSKAQVVIFAYGDYVRADGPRVTFDHIKRIWMYEYPGNSWGPEPPRGGRCYVRMDRHDLTMKLAALAAHKSQGFGTDHIQHVGMSGSQALSALRGSECSAEHAELFYLLREIY